MADFSWNQGCRLLCVEDDVRFTFKSKKLEALYTEEMDAHKYPTGVVDAFFEVMAMMDAAVDERDLRAMKSLRFEKLSGSRKDERSVRLNYQWRLTLSVKKDPDGTYLCIHKIEDYH